MPETNLAIWNAHRTPHPDAMKSFTRAGGFQGTAICPMWIIRAATELWGPVGDKWGWEDPRHEYIDGSDGQILHVCCLDIFYPGPDGNRAVVPTVGQTYLVSKSKNGLRMDEEAPKKSMTDAISKGLSWLGFAADVYMGRHEGSKYADLDVDPETVKAEEVKTANHDALVALGGRLFPEMTEQLATVYGTEEKAQKLGLWGVISATETPGHTMTADDLLSVEDTVKDVIGKILLEMGA